MENKKTQDIYELFGLTFEASEDAIKVAYRRLARKYHPDVNPDEKSATKFKEISKAYELLMNPAKRSQYDAMMQYKRKPKQSAPPPKAAKAQPKQTSSKTTVNVEQNKSFGDVFSGILDGVFRSESTPKPQPINGTDVTANVKITSKEAATGVIKVVNILHTEKCPNCLGQKFINGAQCQMCKGKGEISLHKKISVKIPLGITSRQKIKLSNEGNKGQNGGKNGDLYLVVEVEEDKLFKFEGYNVILEVPITPYEATLGATIDIPTMEGRVSMKIPQGTSSSQKFKLSNQGLLNEKTNKKGDQIIIIKIETNKNLTQEEKELYEKIRLCSKQSIRRNLFSGI